MCWKTESNKIAVPDSSLNNIQSTPKISHHKAVTDRCANTYYEVDDSHCNKPLHPVKAENHQNQEKGLYELAIFLSAIVTGSACSILSKVLYELKGVGLDGELEHFDKPLFLTLVMFVSMIIGIPMHVIVKQFQIRFPGYGDDQPANITYTTTVDTDTPIIRNEFMALLPKGATNFDPELSYGTEEQRDLSVEEESAIEFDEAQNRLPVKTYFALAALSVFDLIATTLCTIGLLYLDVSVYQMLRGSSIIFVALLRQYGLKEHLYHYQWIGVLFNVLSVVLVCIAAIMDASTKEANATANSSTALIGVMFVLAGTLAQALQFVLEEKIMVHDNTKVPPLLLFGMEGLWGFFIGVFVLWPVGYYLPGNDHGSYEDPINTLEMLWNTPSLQVYVCLYMLTIFGYNLFAVLVTFSLSSIWHSILDNFRPMTVWMADILIFYAIAGAGDFGEPWTAYSWIQLAGMFVLLYGTAIYNAPDVGSIQLQGQWYALGLNFQKEYSEIMSQRLFLRGSYPSLHRFLSGSIRTHNSSNSSSNNGAQDLDKLNSEAFLFMDMDL